MMRRMLLLILSAAATVSLMVAIATAGLWIGSHYARWHRIDIDRCKVTNLLDDHGRPYLASEEWRGVLCESGSIIFYRLSDTVDLGPRTTWEFNERVVGHNLREPGQWMWSASKPDIFGNPDQYAEVGVRSWVLLVACSVAPAWWVVTMIRRRRRRRHGEGRCSHCGYDLRATPGRCPECGQSAAPIAGQRRPL
jgi:hypothetical protein